MGCQSSIGVTDKEAHGDRPLIFDRAKMGCQPSAGFPGKEAHGGRPLSFGKANMDASHR